MGMQTGLWLGEGGFSGMFGQLQNSQGPIVTVTAFPCAFAQRLCGKPAPVFACGR
jgi:hypothetical protein